MCSNQKRHKTPNWSTNTVKFAFEIIFILSFRVLLFQILMCEETIQEFSFSEIWCVAYVRVCVNLRMQVYNWNCANTNFGGTKHFAITPLLWSGYCRYWRQPKRSSNSVCEQLVDNNQNKSIESEPTTSETHRKKIELMWIRSINFGWTFGWRMFLLRIHFMHFVYSPFAAPTAIDNNKRNKLKRVFDGQQNAAICCAKATTIMRRLKTFWWANSVSTNHRHHRNADGDDD